MKALWLQRQQALERFNQWERSQPFVDPDFNRLGEAIDLYNKLHTDLRDSDKRLASKIEGLRVLRQAVLKVSQPT